MIGTTGFIGERLKQAREARGLTAVALARLLNVSPTAISHYEKGKHSPRPELMTSIASQLNLPEPFFKRSLLPGDRKERNIFWRSFASATKTARVQSAHKIGWLETIVGYLQDFLDFPSVSLPSFSLPDNILDLSEERIEDLASECRLFWGLNDGPLSEVLLLFENNGVIVSCVDLETKTLDAFSQWHRADGDVPYIVLDTGKRSTVRCRYNAVHELGHLVLHSSVRAQGLPERHKQLEKQAFRFASAFLLPTQSFMAELWAPTLDSFRSLKERWKVSIGVMIKRCEELGVINEIQAQRLWVNYSRRGWRKNEPLDDMIPQENPRLLRRSFELLIEERIKTRSQILLDLPYSSSDIEELAGLPFGYFNREFSAEIAILPKLKPAPQSQQSGPAKIFEFSRPSRS